MLSIKNNVTKEGDIMEGRCSRCGEPVKVKTFKHVGLQVVKVDPCQTCMTREFNEGRGFAQSMIESDLDRVPHGC
jgi:hypothetical protein